MWNRNASQVNRSMPNQINYNLQYPVTLKHKEHVYVTKIDLYIEAALILYLGTSLMFLLDNKKTGKRLLHLYGRHNKK